MPPQIPGKQQNGQREKRQFEKHQISFFHATDLKTRLANDRPERFCHALIACSNQPGEPVATAESR